MMTSATQPELEDVLDLVADIGQAPESVSGDMTFVTFPVRPVEDGQGRPVNVRDCAEWVVFRFEMFTSHVA